MSKSLQHILIMAGGTGGHIFPALAIANDCLAQNIKVTWLGSRGGMEDDIVSKQGIRFECIDIKGVRGKSLFAKALAPFKILRAVWQAYRIIKRVSPDLVLGLGGFASGPGGIAAKCLRIPLAIHEQNAKAGMTNRILAKFAKRTMQAFPKSFNDTISAMTVGNPVRRAICQLPAPSRREFFAKGTLHILILGGSQGAQILNQLVPPVLAQLIQTMPIDVLHQTGKRGLEDAQQRYQQAGLKVKAEAFIDDMAAAYQWADIVICRAGALTIAELMAAGLPSILIPYPHAVDDHQTLNANYLVAEGAAVMIMQPQLTEEYLLNTLLAVRERIPQMAAAAYQLRQPKASETVIHQCQEILL